MNLRVSLPRAASEPHVELLRGSPRPTDARAFRYAGYGEYSPRQARHRKRNSQVNIDYYAKPVGVPNFQITYSPSFHKRDPSYQHELTQSLQETIRRQILSLEDLRTRNLRYQQELDRSQKRNHDLSDQLRRFHQRRDESDSLRKLLKIEKDKSRETLEKMSRSHVTQQRDLLKKKSDIENAYRSLENRFSESEDLNSRQASIIDELNKDISLLRKEFAATKKMNERLVEENQRLIESKKQQSELIETRRAEVESLRKGLDEEKETSNVIEQRIFHIETELRLTKKDLDRVNNELVEKDNRIEELKDDLEAKSDLYIKADSAREDLKRQLMNLEMASEEQLSGKEKIIEDFKQKLSTISNTSETEIVELKCQIDEMKDTIRDQEVLLEESEFSRRDSLRRNSQADDLLQVYKVKLESEKTRVSALTRTVKQQELMLMETMGNMQATAIASQAHVEQIEELYVRERKLSNRLDAFRDLEETLME